MSRSLGFDIRSIEISDFSGGITENVLQGPTTKSFKIDNWYITTDHKLAMRPGIRINDASNQRLPSGKRRVNGLYAIINENILIANSSRHMYYIDTNNSNAWTEILGPGGAEALQGGTSDSQVTFAEFQRQVYFASDSALNNNLGNSNDGVGIQPSKIYRNSSNTWTAKTAGLPRMWSNAVYNQTSLLAKCCALANALKTAFMAHFSDYGGTTTSMHLAYDSTDYNLLNGTADATTQATLFTLTGVLNTAFVAHMQDAATYNASGSTNLVPTYHWNTTSSGTGPAGFTVTGLWTPAKGPNVVPSNTSTPSVVSPVTTASTIKALQTCAAQLDNLHTAYNFHRLGVFNHSFQNEWTVMNRYPVAASKVGRYSVGLTYPTITPDWTDFYNFVNTIALLYNAHVISVVGSHTQQSPANFQIPPQLLSPTTLDGAFLLIYWIRALYSGHINDALTTTYTNITFTSSANTYALTSVALVPSGATTLLVGSYIYANAAFVAADGSSSSFAKVLASGSGTATIDRHTVGGAVSSAQSTLAQMHINTGANVTAGATLTSATVSPVAAAEQIATSNIATGNYLSGNSNTQQYDINSWITLASEVFFCLAQHNAQGNSHIAAGSWISLFSSTLLGFYIPAAANVSYAFMYTDYYQVEQNGIYYLVNSNPVFSDTIQACQSYPQGYVIATTNGTYYASNTVTTTRTNAISNLPSIVNTNETNYDTSNIQINIYRTINNGTSFYLVSSQANGTATYSDNTNDTISSNNVTGLITNQPIYTSGGNVGYDQPPPSKYVEVVNGVCYWGWIQDTGQNFPQRLVQGFQYAPDAVSLSFYDDFEDELTGLGRARNNLVVFCKNSIYREGGGFNNLGQGALVHERISDAIGCLNAKSIVKTEVGIFFAGSDGFYYTDGFQIIKISLELDVKYRNLTQTQTQKNAIYGAYDRLTRRVFWSMRSDAVSQENDIIYVYYLDFGIKPSGSFTRVLNNGNLYPSSLCFISGTLYIGDGRGNILRQDKWTKWDHKIDNTVAATSWVWEPVPYEWLSCAIDAGTTAKRKYYTKMHLVGTNSGNVAMQINAIRDRKTEEPFALKAVNYQENRTWGSPTRIWAANTSIWAYKSKLDLWRRFPGGGLRSDFFQIQCVPATGLAVYSSSASSQAMNFPAGANAQIDATLKTATLIIPSGYSSHLIWPLDVVNMYIAFQTDGYVNQYLITAVSGGVITYSDATNLSVTNAGGLPWVIRGTMKEQSPTITSCTLYYTPLGENFEGYPGAYTSSGPGNSGENPS